MPSGNDLRRRIIEYWDTAQLCSPESSTSRGDPSVKHLENQLEIRCLRRILKAYGGGARALDVGAGYGRFAKLLLRHFQQLVMIEPAESLYGVLDRTWSTNPRVRTMRNSLEDFGKDEQFDFVLASGVIYLYDDEMALDFFSQVALHLNPDGLFVARDFLINGGVAAQVHDSTYVDGAKCHYRNRTFWERTADAAGFHFIELRPSRPVLPMFCKPRWVKALARMRLKWLIKTLPAVIIAESLGGSRVAKDVPEPYYFVMRRN